MPWYSLENISWTGKQTHCMHTRMNTSRTRLDLRFLTLRQSWGNAFPLWSPLVTLSLTVPGNTCLTLSRWDDSPNIVPWPCLDQIEWSNRSTNDIGKSVEHFSLPRRSIISPSPGWRTSAERCEAIGRRSEKVHGLGDWGSGPCLLWILAQAWPDAAGEDPSVHWHLQTVGNEGEDSFLC